MVRGIFCHDLPIYKDKNGVYCSTTLTDDLFQRYFHVVDELIVATRVYPINMTYEEAHQERITLPNITYLEFPNLNTPKGLFTLIPNAQKQLRETMKGVDLIFIRGGIIALLGVEAAKSLGKPYLMESAGCAWDEYWNHSFYGKLIAPFMEYKVKRNVRNASHVIYVTEKWLQNRYPTKGVSTNASNVILEKVDDNVLQKRLCKIATRNGCQPITLGTTAGINNKVKGQQFVIEAMFFLKDELDMRYELVGGGDNTYLKAQAEKYGVADKVVFKGQLTHDEVLQWLDTIDIYIQPSMQEGLPRALIEAMSRACPSIGSTTAGIPELLEEDAIFERGKVTSLVETLKNYIKTDFQYKAKRNFEKSKEYEIEKLNVRREKIYEQYRDYVVKDS